MEKIVIDGDEVYFYDKECPVIGYLKAGHLYGRGNFEILNNLIIERGTILDCGAHIGTFALPASKHFKVVAVEGSRKNFECLQKTFSEKYSVSVYNDILSDEVGKSIGFEDNGAFGHAIEGNDRVTNTIDNIVKDLDEDICAIKLDIEGGEFEALLGAKETINKFKPPILMEVNGFCLMNRNMTPQELLKCVEDLGYSVFVLLNDLFRITSSKIFPFCVQDVICVHNESINRYSFAKNRELSDQEIHLIASKISAQSNSDCKQYYHKIGYV